MTRASEHYCGNNDLAIDLKANGGDKEFGTHSECYKKGYARGYNQQIPDLDQFIRRWSSKYKPHIVQHLYYGDGKTPDGYQQATLSQQMQRGYGQGSISRAQKELKKGHNVNQSARTQK